MMLIIQIKTSKSFTNLKWVKKKGEIFYALLTWTMHDIKFLTPDSKDGGVILDDSFNTLKLETN